MEFIKLDNVEIWDNDPKYGDGNIGMDATAYINPNSIDCFFEQYPNDEKYGRLSITVGKITYVTRNMSFPDLIDMIKKAKDQ